ncbi:Phage-related protein [Thalassovita gelatinovora]|uniref:Phage-related protein n=1 Tax=Thalassovita gelatinovora TaxID=53501 RepID=A0A0P1G8Z7_THAGE|nr:hypothetical protein [Thalassovita gelatinovora]QIZ79077.1 hypothetical protein HFZ77_00590 [Thalassovita gelatinovora]CUH68697.1 Phage-related protein [Thalassovita gelatinovora]SEQ56852.1 hypothetical protein SAMN04488043_106204 [Thalassovita gelatinovora]
MSAIIGALRGVLSLDSAAFDKGVDRSIAKMGKMERRMAQTGARMQRLGRKLSLGITAPMVAIGAAAVKSSLSVVDSQAKMAQSLGTTVKSMQVLGRAADLSGVSVGEVEQATIALTKRLSQAAQGTGPAAKALASLRLEASQLQGLPLDERLASIQKAMAQYVPEAQRAAVASDLFGSRAGVVFSRIDTATLQLATEDVERFGVAVSEADADQIEVTNDAISRMGLAARGVANQLTVAVAPAMESIANAVASVAGWFNGLSSSTQMAIGIMGTLAIAAGPVIAGLGLMASASAPVIRGVAGMIPAMAGAVRQAVALEMALGATSRRAAISSIAIKGMSRALGVLKGALIATGIGALVIGAGVLVSWFSRLVTATGGWGAALKLLGEVASGVWEGIKLSAKSIVPALGAIWADTQAGFVRVLEAMSQQWGTFLWGLGSRLEGIPFFGDMEQGLKNASERAFDSMVELNAEVSSLEGSAIRLRNEAASMAVDGFAQAREAAGKLSAAVADTTDELGDGKSAAADLNDELSKVPKSGGKASKSLKGVKEAAEAFADAMDKAAYTAEDWGKNRAQALISGIDGVADAWGDFLVSGFRDFDGFMDSVVSGFKSGLSQMISMAARNQIMIGLGFGGFAGSASVAGASPSPGASLGNGLLGNVGSSLLGGGAISGIASGLGGILSGGGLGASFANLGGLMSGSVAGWGAIGAAIPAIGLVVAGLSLFIGKTKELDRGLRVTVDGFDALVETFRDTQTSRLFGLIRSNRSHYAAAGEDVADPIRTAVGAIQSDVLSMADILGIGSDVFADFTAQIRISTKDLSDDEIAAALQEQLTQIADGMADLALASYDVVRDGESASAALDRLSTHLVAVQTIADTMGHSFDQVGVAGAAMASDLVDAFGGLEAMNASATTYYEAFYSAAERQAVTLRHVTTAFEDLNLSMPQTRAAYRSLVEAQDLATESGRDVYAALIGMASALDEVLPSVAGFTAMISGLVGDTSSLVDGMIADASTMARDAATAASNWYKASETIRDLLGDLISANTDTNSGRDQALRYNEGQYNRAYAAARGGDIDAARSIPGLAQDYLASVRASASSYSEVLQAQARLSADANFLSGISALQGANEDVLVTLYNEQIGIMEDVRDYLAGAEQIDPDDIASFEARLGSLQGAIEQAELFSYDYLRERLKVTVDLLPTADIPKDVADLIGAAATGIQSSIDFAVHAAGLTPDLRWLAVNAASEHIKTIDFVMGADLPPNVARLALNQVGDLSKTVNLLAGSDIAADLKRIALAGSSELGRVVNVTLAANVNQQAMQLALQNVGAYDVAVRAALHPSVSDDVRHIVFSDIGTYVASIEAALSQDMPNWARSVLLGRQGRMIVNITGILASGMSSSVSRLLLNANTHAVRGVTVAMAFAGSVSAAERDLLLRASLTTMRQIQAIVNPVGWTADDLLFIRQSATNGSVRRNILGGAWMQSGAYSNDGLRLLRMNSDRVDRVVRGRVDLSGMNTQQRSLLTAVSGASAGTLRLSGGFVFNPAASFATWYETATRSAITSPMSTLTGALSSLRQAVLNDIADRNAQNAAAANTAQRQQAFSTYAAKLGRGADGSLITSDAQLRSLAQAGGLSTSGSEADIQARVAGYMANDDITRIVTGAADIQDYLFGVFQSQYVPTTQAKYSQYYNGLSLPHYERYGRDEIIAGVRQFKPHAFNWSSVGINIPGFATGGFHMGGLRVVGEHGPELEATGPSRIFTHSQTKQMLGGDPDIQRRTLQEQEKTRREIEYLRDGVRRLVVANETSAKALKYLKDNGILLDQTV